MDNSFLTLIMKQVPACVPRNQLRHYTAERHVQILPRVHNVQRHYDYNVDGVHAYAGFACKIFTHIFLIYFIHLFRISNNIFADAFVHQSGLLDQQR